jgi:signal transduction histidine kinase
MLVYRTLFFVFLAFSSTVVYGVQAPHQHIGLGRDINSYEKLVVHYRYDKPDSALYFAKAGMKLAQKNNDQQGIARMLNQMGMIDDNSGRADSSRWKYRKALEIYERLGDKKGIIKENIRLGAVENRDGSFDRSNAHLLVALKLSERLKDKQGIMESYVGLAEVAGHQGGLNKAFSYFGKAEVLSRSLPFSNVTLNLYAGLGTVYREKRDYPMSIFYYEKGISQSNFAEMMGSNISMTNGLAQVYAKLGETDKAISLQKAALIKSRKIKNTIREYISLTALAESYSHKDPAIALNYLDEALKLAQSKKANKQAIEVLAQIAKLQEKANNFKAAYLAKSRQYNIADSFYFKAISLKIANLEAQYELNKSQVKVQELKFINSKQALEQKIILSILAGIVVLLVIFGIYFYKIRNLNRLLNKSNSALTESNTVKDKLFSVLAHDLRAPLASVISLIDMISNGWLTEEEREVMMSKLAVHCNASMESLNLLLRWGQMQLKGIMINQVALSPLKIVDRNISLLLEQAEQKSILIEKNIPADINVFCDADHLDFLIRNILSNAIKFTTDGGCVLISAQRYTEGKILFTVKDSGVGIEPERLKSIFDITNISTNGTNNEKGTSLGLAICKEFVTANEGKIWVESTAGEGSEFFFILKEK